MNTPEPRPAAAQPVPLLKVLLRLGRVSNLPTVWSNVLTGCVVSGVAFAAWHYALLALALSSLYVGGMFLNDAFDHKVDRRTRPERPIPAGQIRLSRVFVWGFGLLFMGALLVALSAFAMSRSLEQSRQALASALVLCGLIVLYDLHHKANALSPLLMGLCRVLVYVTSCLAVSARVGGPLIVAASVLLCYLIGLTYVAKQENVEHVGHLWPLAFLFFPELVTLPSLIAESPLRHGAGFGSFVPLTCWLLLLGWTLSTLTLLYPNAGQARGARIGRAVGRFIAGIALCDALLLAGAGKPALALAALVAFLLTLTWQRWVPGT